MDIAAGMAHLHDSGVIHCDLKPHNVLICRQAASPATQGSEDVFFPKIADLDCHVRSRSGCMRWPVQHSPRGTPGFRAPEVEKAIKNKQKLVTITPAVDVYSYGCLLRKLFDLRDSESEGPYSQQIGRDQEALILMCLNNKPSLRPSFGDIVGVWKVIERGERERTKGDGYAV